MAQSSNRGITVTYVLLQNNSNIMHQVNMLIYVQDFPSLLIKLNFKGHVGKKAVIKVTEISNPNFSSSMGCSFVCSTGNSVSRIHFLEFCW